MKLSNENRKFRVQNKVLAWFRHIMHDVKYFYFYLDWRIQRYFNFHYFKTSCSNLYHKLVRFGFNYVFSKKPKQIGFHLKNLQFVVVRMLNGSGKIRVQILTWTRIHWTWTWNQLLLLIVSYLKRIVVLKIKLGKILIWCPCLNCEKRQWYFGRQIIPNLKAEKKSFLNNSLPCCSNVWYWEDC